MSDRFDNKSKSKPTVQIKGKPSKPKSKTNLSSYTPNKYQKPKENNININKVNPNNSTVQPENNNHYNINNNISININIEMPKNRNKSMNMTKAKNNPYKKPISIKKVQLNNNNNNLIFNTLKNYNNNNKNNSKKGPFHIRIKSANMNDFKYTNSNKNNNAKLSNNSVVDVNHNNNFSSTMNDFKKVTDINDNKTSIEQKNASMDNININENKDNNNNISAKKEHNLSIATGQVYNPKIISNKLNQNNKYVYKKNIGKKRGNFSPSVNRELLNKKQNAIFNYSTENRKNNNANNNNKTVVSEINNKILKLKNNFGYAGSSQPSFNNQIALKKKIIPNSKENNSKINNLNNNRKQNLNNKTKSPINKSNNELKNIVKNANKKEPTFKSPNVKKIKNVKIFNNNIEKKDSKKETKEKDENQQKEEEKKKQIEEEKISKEQNENGNKIEEEQKKNQLEEKKRKMNPSKSQKDIGSEFIKKNLEDKTDIIPENLKPSDPASKKIRQIESICKKGFAGPGVKKTNQDNFFIYKNFLDCPDHIFLGVCDGHGMYGHDVSGYLVNHLPQNLNTSLMKDNIKSISNSADYPKISDIISLTFVQTNINIVNDDNVESTFSGTTCSSLIFCPTKIISANVGDSRCVLGKFDGKNWKAKNLTRDHKPNEEDEKKRIIEKGGRIESYKDEDGEFVGPERVWLKNEDVPGLAMSRSFGDDVAHSVGVISQPEIFEYNFVNEDKFIMLASDGIWEFISSDECVNIVKDYYLKDDIDGALSYLYKESSKRWIMEEEVIDDITLIIMFLN